MGGWLSSVAAAVGNHLWQSTAFALAAWGVTLLLRRNQARVRYRVWLAASVKFLVPFSLLIGLGGMLPRPQHPVVTMPVYSAVDEVGLPFSDVENAPIDAANSTDRAMMPRHGWGNLAGILAGVWSCGVLAVLGVWMGRWRRVAQTVRRAVRVECGREAQLLQRLEARMGGQGRPIPLMLSREWMEPGMFGVWRPVLIWPEGLSERLSDEHIEAVMIHELAHATRWDNLTAALHMVVEAAFWFHPLVWWMERRMVEERERACDEAVVALGGRPEVYAESLLKAVRFCVESPLVCVAGITGADLSRRVRSIMTLRLQRLGVVRMVALAMLALAAIAGPVAFGVVRMIPLYGQMLHATGPRPAFDVVAIKPSQEPPQGSTTTGEQVRLVVTAKLLVQLAYNVPMMSDEHVVGGPEWIDTDVFDILAKMDSAKFISMRNLNREQKREQQQLMEESLLADRFKLKMHFETRDLPVYALTTTKNFKLKPVPVAPGGATVMTSPQADTPRPEDLRRGLIVQAKGRGFQMTAKGVTMDGLMHALIPRPELRGRTVVDQTGLKDAYDFTLNWGPEQTTTPESGEVEEPTLFAALQQQLGLKLTAAKGPGEVIVIDHIEKPAFDEAMVAVPSLAARILSGALKPANVSTAPSVQATTNDWVKDAGGNLEFDVASVRQNKSGDKASSNVPLGTGGVFGPTGGLLVAKGFPVLYYLEFAYKMTDYQAEALQKVAPGWISTDRFDIEARTGIRNVTKDQLRLMMQSLLADRFKVAVHYVTREDSVYALIAIRPGTTGPKLQPHPAGAPCWGYFAGALTASDGTRAETTPEIVGNGFPAVCNGIVGVPASAVDRYSFGARNVPMRMIASVLSSWGNLGRPVIDKTGLGGAYDFVLKFTPEPPPKYAKGVDSGGPAFEEALQKQLGLKLASQKGPVAFLELDHIERPSAN